MLSEAQNTVSQTVQPINTFVTRRQIAVVSVKQLVHYYVMLEERRSFRLSRILS